MLPFLDVEEIFVNEPAFDFGQLSLLDGLSLELLKLLAVVVALFHDVLI